MADIDYPEERRVWLYVPGITSAVWLWPSEIVTVPAGHEA